MSLDSAREIWSDVLRDVDDFGLQANTGQMGLILPTGVGFTFNSGVFLTQTEGSSTPEPGSLLLMGLGIAAVAGFGHEGSILPVVDHPIAKKLAVAVDRVAACVFDRHETRLGPDIPGPAEQGH